MLKDTVVFKAKIQIIGVNPYVLLPASLLNKIFTDAGKDKGPIPVKGTINKKKFKQTLVKYSGKWRLYLNMPMRKAGQCDVGDYAIFTLHYDSVPRITPMPKLLAQALQKNKGASTAFKKLPTHYQKEIMRYINNLKAKESVQRAVDRAIRHLTGDERFVGRHPVKK